MKQLALLLMWTACGSHPEPRHDDIRDSIRDARTATVDASAATYPRRWLAGDFHMHVSPPDDPHDVSLDAKHIADAAAKAGMDFVVLTPHVWPARWGDTFRHAWKTLAADAAAITSLTMIPGVEWTTGDGHFTVIGDIAALPNRGDFLANAHAAGAFISTNHPFAVPTRFPGIPASHFDMSYKVWTDHRQGFTAIDGAEVWNVPLSFANIFSKPGGRTGEDRTWTELDRIVHDEHRRVSAIGGTDNHRFNVMATTWVLAADATAGAILEALAHGATCIGGPEAGSFRARSTDDNLWVRIGDNLVTKTIELAWEGTARLFIDDKDEGEHDGGFTHDTGGTLHTYRIAKGSSRSGFIYANLPGA